MDKTELTLFLKKFSLSEDVITDFLKDKQLEEVNGNIFLVSQPFEKHQVYDSMMIFISLEEVVPTRDLLEFIFKHTNNLLKISSHKQIQRVLYGEDLSVDAISKKVSFTPHNYYLVVSQKNVLGVIEYLGVGKFPFKNLYNIGQYLKEG